jgi:hypothetical protein
VPRTGVGHTWHFNTWEFFSNPRSSDFSHSYIITVSLLCLMSPRPILYALLHLRKPKSGDFIFSTRQTLYHSSSQGFLFVFCGTRG